MDIKKEDSTLLKLLSTMNRCKEVFDCNELTTIEDILNKAMDEIQTLRTKVAELQEQLSDRESDLKFEHTERVNSDAQLDAIYALPVVAYMSSDENHIEWRKGALQELSFKDSEILSLIVLPPRGEV